MILATKGKKIFTQGRQGDRDTVGRIFYRFQNHHVYQILLTQDIRAGKQPSLQAERQYRQSNPSKPATGHFISKVGEEALERETTPLTLINWLSLHPD